MKARLTLAMLPLPLMVLFSSATPPLPAAAPAAIERSTLEQLGFRAEGPSAEPGGEWLAAQRVGKNGGLPANAYVRAIAQAKAVGEMTAEVAPEIADANWEFMGPQNIGGRVVEVAVAPSHGTCAASACTGAVYAATASGGIWKSADAGVTFTRSWPNDLTHAMGAVAVGSDGVIYAGTGETNPGGGSIVYGGTGLYRSKDGAATWQSIGLPTSGAIGRIAVDPTNPKRIFVASSGNLYVPGGERGLYRSLDGGDTWTRVLAGDNATTGAADVSIDPVNPNNLLVGMWDHVRLPTHRLYSGPGSGVYRSTNGGATWTRATLPTAPAPAQVGRIGVAFAPSNPTRAYAVIANQANGNGVGLWRSNDGGATWTKASAAGTGLSQSSYGWWFGKIWVDPRISDRLFVAGLELSESVDGGNTFFPHSNSTAGVATGATQGVVHADQHAMVWDPSAPSRVYLGNDGGMWVSEANGVAGSWRAAVLQGFTQHYSVGVSEQNPGRAVSGLQDNMCQRNYGAGPQGTHLTWHKYGLCGDGLQTLVKPTNENIIYGCAQYGGNCSRTLEDGTAFEFLGGFEGARKGWWVPIIFDPTNADVMYAGTNNFERSTDGGLSWSAISPDLTKNGTQFDPNPGYKIMHTITTVAAGKSNANVLMAGSDDGLVHRSDDGGTSWDRLTDHDDGDEDLTDDADIPNNLWVTTVAIDPADAGVIYATFSGFRNGSDAPHVVRSLDGGYIWDDISGNLPDAPVTDLAVAGSRVIVSTDVGVYLTDDGGTTWLRVGSNLPTVPVLDLRYHAATKILTVSTFGQGIQRVTLP